MNLERVARVLKRLCALSLVTMASIVHAQNYPSRPVRIVVGFPPGGPTDIVARLIGPSLSEQLSQPFVVENRPGAGGNIGARAVVQAQPDGYTLLLVSAANAISASLYPHLEFVFLRDIAPIAGIMRVPNVMEVHPSVPVTAVREFIAYAKRYPGKVKMAGVNGTTLHLAGEMFKMMARVDLMYVPYKGAGPALVDLLGGQVDLLFDTLSSSIQYIKAGKLRALAVTTVAPSAALPDVPTLGESVPGYEASAWQGIGAPSGTSARIVQQLNAAINAALSNAGIRGRVKDLGGEL